MTYYPDTAEIVHDEAADAYAKVAESLIHLRDAAEIEGVEKLHQALRRYHTEPEFRMVISAAIRSIQAAQALWSRCEVDVAEFLEGGGYGA
jgi:hypothetical protein